MREDCRESVQERRTIGKKTCQMEGWEMGQMWEGWLDRQERREKSIYVFSTLLASDMYLVLSCLMFARNHICVLIDGHLPVTVFKMDIYNDTYHLWLCMCVKSKPCGYVCVYVHVDWWFRSFFFFFFCLMRQQQNQCLLCPPTHNRKQWEMSQIQGSMTSRLCLRQLRYNHLEKEKSRVWAGYISVAVYWNKVMILLVTEWICNELMGKWHLHTYI